MKKSSRLVFYLILNILISAATTLAVLAIWEHTHSISEELPDTATAAPTESAGSTDESTPTSQPTSTEAGTTLVTDDLQVIIRTVVGAGNLEAEYVEIYNQTEGTVDLTGWQIQDESENRFTFPALILNNGGSVKVYSKSGSDTVIELYWQADLPIWQSGETVSLVDGDGNTVATYSIP